MSKLEIGLKPSCEAKEGAGACGSSFLQSSYQETAGKLYRSSSRHEREFTVLALAIVLYLISGWGLTRCCEDTAGILHKNASNEG